MSVGQFRHAVTVLHPGRIPADPETWWCAIQGIGSQVTDGQAAFLVTGRYRPDVTLETQLDFDGRILQVQAITDPDERHVLMRLSCEEVRGRA